MSQIRRQPRKQPALRPGVGRAPELHRLEAQVQELLRLCRAQEARLGELEAEVQLRRFSTHQPNLGIDL